MKSFRIGVLAWGLIAIVLLVHAVIAPAQEAGNPPSGSIARDSQQATPATAQALRVTLQDALTLARKNSTQFQSAQTDAAIARQDRYQAAAALLPGVTYNNQALYTQLRNGSVAFIANNTAHEYVSQANVHESIDLLSISNFRRSSAAAALAKARAEVASRGLVVTVVQSYYAV